MGFDGTEGRAISLPDAAALTKEHRSQNPNARMGHFFGKDIIEAILNQGGCMGIRIYYGINADSGERELVLVGADEKEDDIIGIVADFSKSCPSNCSSANDLNS
ncbi:MAG: hypothetical protein HWE22_04490 [Flavobacteriales bacterium]|nr:hypothetical protein [Flavobacteriales bacterium]